MVSPLCQYKDVLGVPGTGLHSVRIFDVAILDFAGVFVLAWLMSKATGLRYLLSWLVVFLFVIGIHRAFCVNTTVNKAIFGVI